MDLIIEQLLEDIATDENTPETDEYIQVVEQSVELLEKYLAEYYNRVTGKVGVMKGKRTFVTSKVMSFMNYNFLWNLKKFYNSLSFNQTHKNSDRYNKQPCHQLKI